MSIFGSIKTAGTVEQAALDTLKLWFETYLREIELQTGRGPGSLPNPRTYDIEAELDERTTEEQLPAVYVISPGLTEPPYLEGDGHYWAKFQISVAVVVSANTKPNTVLLAKVYAAVARAIILQKRSLGSVACGTTWIDESYDDAPTDAERTLGIGMIAFEVSVDDVVERDAGPPVPVPPDPVTQPGSEWPTVLTADATVQQMEE